MRTCISSVCLAWLLTGSLFAADPVLVVPQLSKPATAPADDDPFKAKYEAAWTQYETNIGKITESVNKALDSQFEKAADAGNLDLADMWDKKKKGFVDTRTLEWPSDGKAKTEWRRKYPDIEFPDDFTEVIKAAQEAYAAAVTSLKGDYESLVKDYTKERNLGRAKQLRDEVAGLERKAVVQPERPRMVESKPEPRRGEDGDSGTQTPKDGKYIFACSDGGGWLLEKKGNVLLVCGAIAPGTSNGMNVWAKSREVTLKRVGNVLSCDDRSPEHSSTFTFQWNVVTGEGVREMPTGETKRGVVRAKAW